jgi:hypothetical protein
MATDHYDPHGQALLDYFNGDTSATIVIHERGKQVEYQSRRNIPHGSN